jgi:hypothetical protein
VVLGHDALNLGDERKVTPDTRRCPKHVPVPRGMLAIRRRGDLKHPTDRLDSVSVAVLVDERAHHFVRRSSSAWAKYADALRRISLAWRSSRFSRSSARMRSCSAVVGPARRP